jgi:hypothetical protein
MFFFQSSYLAPPVSWLRLAYTEYTERIKTKRVKEGAVITVGGDGGV